MGSQRSPTGSQESHRGARSTLPPTKDGCTPIAKAVVLPRSPDEALVVDIAGGLKGDDMIKQANGVLVKTASRVGNHGEKGDVLYYGIGPFLLSVERGWCVVLFF